MYDTHCHLAFDAYEGRVDEVVDSARAASVQGMITVATSAVNVEANLQIADRFDCVWFSAGVHPLHAHDPTDWARIRAAAEHPRCVAFGELGLDYHYTDRYHHSPSGDPPLGERCYPTRNLQHRILEEQLAFLESWKAEALEKPVILHCREAFEDLIPILRRTTLDPQRFVFHCFTGTPDDARRILDFGAWISFTGVVTYPNAREVAEAARLVPEDRLMVETDSPFLSPVPLRGRFPNEPSNVVHIGRFIADLRGVDRRKFEQQVDANASTFFGLPPYHHAPSGDPPLGER